MTIAWSRVRRAPITAWSGISKRGPDAVNSSASANSNLRIGTP